MKKSFKTIALCLACVMLLVYGIVAKKTEKPILEVEGYKQILELWHIDSFEGGIGSRRDFLLKRAISFDISGVKKIRNVSNQSVKRDILKVLKVDVFLATVRILIMRLI